ncbi:carbohydrate ABC transporter permease [Pseudarthrobacter sp. S9]|uniref:carbohydrate ABC transporter permease n=1 Tax=Pseudarthrobacter sp. S9 TaxID=3418421 RepID=UPI003CFDBC6D
MQVIPGEVYEAAQIDGAGWWRQLGSITLPLVKPTLLVAVLFRMLDALRMFGLPFPDRPRQGVRGNPLHAGLGRVQPAPAHRLTSKRENREMRAISRSKALTAAMVSPARRSRPSPA